MSGYLWTTQDFFSCNTSLVDYYAGGWNEQSSLFYEVFLILPYMPWSLVTSIYFINIYFTMIMRWSCYHYVVIMTLYDSHMYSWNNEFLHNTTHINAISCVNLYLFVMLIIFVQYFYPECYFSVKSIFVRDQTSFKNRFSSF